MPYMVYDFWMLYIHTTSFPQFPLLPECNPSNPYKMFTSIICICLYQKPELKTTFIVIIKENKDDCND